MCCQLGLWEEDGADVQSWKSPEVVNLGMPITQKVYFQEHTPPQTEVQADSVLFVAIFCHIPEFISMEQLKNIAF